MSVSNKKDDPSLSDFMQNGALHHAYLLVGTSDHALSQMVLTLFCESKVDGKACEHCHACEAVARRVHADLFWVNETDKTIKIDTIREVIHFAGLGAARNGYRVIVLPHVERLMLPAANALLKTLEEPPKRVVFLLSARSLHGLSATLVSRCQKIRWGGQANQFDQAEYETFKSIFLKITPTPFDTVSTMDQLALPNERLFDYFMTLTHEEVKRRTLQGLSTRGLFRFYKNLIQRKIQWQKVPQLNAEILSYHFASEWQMAFCET